ncbi:hypothetical protein SISNIDRAFT_473518 [Sistotremastrum niveocremeum HHB9708]|uniref:Eukaryotic translation initiation factor 3 subunit H n=2 Tax=Sistotremastraceae TaxID=3402574 RepID=A0A164XN61_9AGAM|nr:hypothetical protein SISNIDRAFT_473518 [Sistotremastrum niveocremeum HHB9708]KZT44527.1 translation initiation factor 3 subunit 3 [Sistotremastrum suecicum HHB10207 ss-3]
MATSMAATLAASLPAVQAAPAPTVSSYEALPASMSKVIDIEAQIPITRVQIDALVLTKITKHGQEAKSNNAAGLLLGLDLDGTLEVSNSFPLPTSQQAGDEEDKSTKFSGDDNCDAARYQASMLRALKEVQVDDNVVGFYQTISLGAYLLPSIKDMQAVHQEKLRHGGVVVVHDVTQSSRGIASFRAFRLTKNFTDVQRKGKFNSQNLVEHGLTFSSVFEEIPVEVRKSALLNAFLGGLKEARLEPDFSPRSALGVKEVRTLGSKYGVLDLNGPGQVNRNLEQVIERLDEYKTEEGNVAYLTRQSAREKARAELYVQKRKEENAARVAQGLAPLPEEDVSRLFKIPGEPSRLESMLLLGQIDGYTRSLAVASSDVLVKTYATRSSTPL